MYLNNPLACVFATFTTNLLTYSRLALTSIDGTHDEHMCTYRYLGTEVAEWLHHTKHTPIMQYAGVVDQCLKLTFLLHPLIK